VDAEVVAIEARHNERAAASVSPIGTGLSRFDRPAPSIAHYDVCWRRDGLDDRHAAAAAIGTASRELRLPVVRTDAARLAEIAQRSQMSYMAFLADVLTADVDERAERRRQRRITGARFPRTKRLADFDLGAAPPSTPPASPPWRPAPTWTPASPSCSSATAAPASPTF
jgi:hypothetical protein